MSSKQPKPSFTDKIKALFNAHICAAEPHADKCPLKAPWPPGVMTRVVDHPLHGPMMQLRDGASLPHGAHHLMRQQAYNRFPKSYSLN